MSDLIKELWTNTNMLLRYVLSGFVVLFVGWAADDSHTVLEAMECSLGSPWPVLMLAPVLGFVLFSVHSVLCYSTYGFLAYRWANKSLRHGSWRQAWHEHLELFGKRLELITGHSANGAMGWRLSPAVDVSANSALPGIGFDSLHEKFSYVSE